MFLPDPAGLQKNETETTPGPKPSRTRTPSGDGYGRCRFIVSGETARPRFCDATSLPGSAYCRLHHTRCTVRPGTAAGTAAIRAFEREAARGADLPLELAFLSSIDAPELDSADGPDDIAACFDRVPERATEDE